MNERKDNKKYQKNIASNAKTIIDSSQKKTAVKSKINEERSSLKRNLMP